MKKELSTKISRTLGKAMLKLKKHSPGILVTAGIVGVVASTVMACKATVKAGEVLEEHTADMEKIHKAAEIANPGEYTEEDMKKDTSIVYIQTGVKFAKLYAPAIALGAASIACIVGSHHILNKRNAALAAAYATIDKGFKEYRHRVIERFSEELDRELKYGVTAQNVEETTTDDKGRTKTVNKFVDTAVLDNYSDYARFFDEYCKGWSKDPEFNLMFLRRQQDSANEILKARGYIFLNEVYDMLGIQRTRAGQCVGWFYNEKNPTGDNYVDFGMYDIQNAKARDFVNGRERSILLDFNVDGNILDFI